MNAVASLLSPFAAWTELGWFVRVDGSGWGGGSFDGFSTDWAWARVTSRVALPVRPADLNAAKRKLYHAVPTDLPPVFCSDCLSDRAYGGGWLLHEGTLAFYCQRAGCSRAAHLLDFPDCATREHTAYDASLHGAAWRDLWMPEVTGGRRWSQRYARARRAERHLDALGLPS